MKVSLQIMFAILTTVATACPDRNQSNHDNTQEAPSRSEGTHTDLANGPTQYCFREDYGSAGAQSPPDSLLLIVHVDGEQVSGSYDWLPAYKDTRRGRFEGVIREGVISASYDFQQEGVYDSVVISIVMHPDAAIVSGGAAELGLGATISRVSCQ